VRGVRRRRDARVDARVRIAFYPGEKRDFHFARKFFRATRACVARHRPRRAAAIPPPPPGKYFCKTVDIQKSRD
jgi:hypothetical protein